MKSIACRCEILTYVIIQRDAPVSFSSLSPFILSLNDRGDQNAFVYGVCVYVGVFIRFIHICLVFVYEMYTDLAAGMG